MKRLARPPLLPKGSRILYPAPVIEARVERLADRILAGAPRNEELTVIVVLHGAMVFASALVRHLEVPVRAHAVMASSYRGTALSPRVLRLQLDHLPPLRERHVLLVDDILDTGQTLSQLHRAIGTHGPASLRTVTLLDKPFRRSVPFEADLRGFVIPDVFVVGYGLDYAGRYRNLPHIVALDGTASR